MNKTKQIKRIIKIIYISFPVLIMFLLNIHGLHAGEIYICDYKSNTEVVVYVTRFKSEAHLIVYKTKYKSEAKGRDDIWCFTKWKSSADSKIFYTKWKSKADVIIYFSKWKTDAGWKKANKFQGEFK